MEDAPVVKQIGWFDTDKLNGGTTTRVVMLSNEITSDHIISVYCDTGYVSLDLLFLREFATMFTDEQKNNIRMNLPTCRKRLMRSTSPEDRCEQ